MKEHSDHMDNSIKEKFDSHEVPVPSKLWDAIQSKLPAENTSNTVSFWKNSLFLSSVLLISIVSICAAFYYFPDYTKNIFKGKEYTLGIHNTTYTNSDADMQSEKNYITANVNYVNSVEYFTNKSMNVVQNEHAASLFTNVSDALPEHYDSLRTDKSSRIFFIISAINKTRTTDSSNWDNVKQKWLAPIGNKINTQASPNKNQRTENTFGVHIRNDENKSSTNRNCMFSNKNVHISSNQTNASSGLKTTTIQNKTIHSVKNNDTYSGSGQGTDYDNKAAQHTKKMYVDTVQKNTQLLHTGYQDFSQQLLTNEQKNTADSTSLLSNKFSQNALNLISHSTFNKTRIEDSSVSVNQYVKSINKGSTESDSSTAFELISAANMQSATISKKSADKSTNPEELNTNTAFTVAARRAIVNQNIVSSTDSSSQIVKDTSTQYASGITDSAYALNKTNALKDSLARVIKTDSIQTQATTVGEKEKIKKNSTFLSRCSIDGYITPSLAYMHLNSNNATDPTSSFITDRNRSATSGRSVIAGLRINYALSEKLEIGFGLQYSGMKQNTSLTNRTLDSSYYTYQGYTHTDSTFTSDSTGTQNVTYTSNYVKTDSTLVNGYSTHVKKYIDKYQSISLPIYIAYRFEISNRFAIITRASLLVNYMTYSVTYLNESADHILGYHSEKKISLGGSFSVGAYYALSEKYTVFAEPVANYYFPNAFGKKAPFKQHMLTVGLQVGVRFKL